MSDYSKRDMTKFLYPIFDELTHRTYYDVYDVTEYLNDGENVLSIWLGNGFYRQTERICEGDMVFGNTLPAIYYMEIETENTKLDIFSDGDETWIPSEIVYSNLFVGEIWDFTKKVEEKKVEIIDNIETKLTKSIGVADKVIRILKPVMLGEVNGKIIYDVGENISGVVRFTMNIPEGESVTLRFAENINDDLSLNFDSTGSNYTTASGRKQIMTDTFVSDGEKHICEPKFVWHSFRYFEADNEIENPDVLVIHSDVAVTSEFESTSEGLNFLYDAYVRSQLDNMHGSIPSDCPHRERLGYTGDGQICAEAGMTIFDSREFYRKWICDILDCQDIHNGHVQHTAPMMGGGGGPCAWGNAIVQVPYMYYKKYGDTDMLAGCYEPMKKWVSYTESRTENGLVVREEKDGWCLGDWVTLEKVEIPAEFVNSCMFIKMLRQIIEIAKIIGKDEDVADYAKMINSLEKGVKDNFYKDAGYCGGIQGADAFAVFAGFEGADMVKKLAEKYDGIGHFDTGFLGTPILLEVLFEYGYADVAMKLLEREEKGSFLYMKRNGATTLWENWSGAESHNHPFLGACSVRLFDSILGIKQEKESAGYESVVIEPALVENLDGAKGSIVTPQGRICVERTKCGEKTLINIDLPDGVIARFKYKKIDMEICGNNAFKL